MKDEQFYPCAECQVGAMRPRQASYFAVHGGQPVCVPDFPAWICDVCGRSEYDASALAQLRAMLENSRVRRVRRKRRPARDPDLHPATDTPRRRP